MLLSFKEQCSCPKLRTKTLCHFGLGNYLNSIMMESCGEIKVK
ncbi:hypothetical protein QF041_000751 [Paenibacillus sp. W2I17]|nr:hypothetical protein [Paenibacillus sp. W2I17]